MFFDRTEPPVAVLTIQNKMKMISTLPGKCYVNILFSIVFLFICSGCGSMRTLPPGSEYDLKHNERYETTYCNKITRIYSGIFLDFCLAFIGPAAPEDYDGPELYGYLTDIMFCSIVDTLALPYTSFRQMNDGSLHLKRVDVLNF